jgi:hypothetical protein
MGSTSLGGAASSTRSPDPQTAAHSDAQLFVPTRMGKGMMLDHLRVLRLSCRHHGARRQCEGRGERAGVVIHLESVVAPLPNFSIVDSLSAENRCAEVVTGRPHSPYSWAPGHMVSPSILPMRQEFHLRLDGILLGIGAIVPTWKLCVYPAHLGSSPAGRTQGSGS